MKLVNKESLLKTLGYVTPGLSNRDIIEQSSCFVFKNKEVVTFNNEVACRMACDAFDDGEAAIPSKLADILTKIPDEEVGLELSANELVISGKKRRVGLKIERDVLLPTNDIEQPKEWKSLLPEFSEAVGTVHLCASRDESNQTLTCVHITPEWLEARDECQACRWNLATGFDSSCLVRQNSIKQISSLGMTHFCLSDTWVHFKNSTGLTFSCRQWKEDYPSLKIIFSTKDKEGNQLPFIRGTLPKSLAEVCERAEFFSSENSDKGFNRLKIMLKPGRAKIRGEGVMGWYEESKKIGYEGQSMTFWMNPRILSSIVRKHTEVDMANDRMRINGGNHVYVTSLQQEIETKDDNAGENDSE